ncbi:MAG TPA: NAD(P)H-hydrate dehydratase [Chthonomonadaceae bacterium]|nr:NAD(P)H-hydrate dehydratase [Chthonomonadaceae bacterium]
MVVMTAQQLRDLDARAMSEFGIPGVVLMENAGRAVVDAAAREFGTLSGKRVAVFCGAGNNGGDGFVALRLLALEGAIPTLFCSEDALAPGKAKGDAAAHLAVAMKIGLVQQTALPHSAKDGGAADSRAFDLAIDALLGTGAKGEPRGWTADAIRAINDLDCPVIAVDIPSGVDADSGAAPGEAVRADLTVTFAYPKLGLFLHPGYERAGRVHVADIGFPWGALRPPEEISVLACAPGAVGRLTSSESLHSPIGWEPLLRPRPPESNKGDFGHIAIVAGARGMAGAPALVARAAQRAGAGLVTVLTPESNQPLVAAKLDEQMTRPLAEKEGAVAEDAWGEIAKFAERATVLCIGPGLTTADEAVRLVHRALREIATPIVLDADGLNALAQDPSAAQDRGRAGAPLTITPHPGEAARLLGTSVQQVQSDRVAAVRGLARKFHAVAVLKGRYTLIAEPDGRVYINTSGNPGMASGGMGDALTGVVGALEAQWTKMADGADQPMTRTLAVALAVHLHGVAGDLAANDREAGMTAGDLIDCLPAARARLAPAN